MTNLNLTTELSSTATQALNQGIEEASTSLSLDITTISNTFLPRIQKFKSRFNQAYLDYVNELDNDKKQLEQAVTPDFERRIKVKLKSKDIQSDKANELAAIMLEGLTLLNEIRAVLTGTTITTHFYHKGSDGRIYPIKISDLKPVLSLYGASGTLSNPFSLALQMEGEIVELCDEIQEDKKQNKEYDFYLYLEILDRAKDLYVD